MWRGQAGWQGREGRAGAGHPPGHSCCGSAGVQLAEVPAAAPCRWDAPCPLHRSISREPASCTPSSTMQGGCLLWEQPVCLCVHSQAHSDQLSTASRAPASLGSGTPLLRHQAAQSPGTQKSAPLQPSPHPGTRPALPCTGRLTASLGPSATRTAAPFLLTPHPSLPAPRGHSPSWSHPQEPKQGFCVPSLLPVLISASRLLCFSIPTPHEAPWAGTAPAGLLALRSWARTEPERV